MTKEKYNSWSESYDSDSNPTRDLDSIIVRQIVERYNGKRIVEIGCGTGKNTILLSKIASQVHAIDFSKEMLEKTKKKLKDKMNMKFTSTDIREKWPCEDRSTDVIMCSLVLEHIENLDFIFSEASRILVGSGEFFINEFHPYRQYQGKKANYTKNGKRIEITSYVHNISEFVNIAFNNKFKLNKMDEWWYEKESETTPRLITFIFSKIK